jgi:hypothetical protein
VDIITKEIRLRKDRFHYEKLLGDSLLEETQKYENMND